MESVKRNKTRRRKFLDSPRSNIKLPKAWAYKEFLIGGKKGLFTSQTGNFDIQKKHLNGKGYYVVSSGEQNNGIVGKTDAEALVIEENTITVDMFGNVYFRDHKYKMVTHARVFTLEFKERELELSKEIGMYLVAQMQYFRQKFSYSNMASFEKIKNTTITLPITESGEIDFAFMEQYIRELEFARIRELEIFLKVCGFTDCNLTQEELSAIEKFRMGGGKIQRISNRYAA